MGCLLSDSKQDGKIGAETFIDHLMDAGESVSELSLMMLQIRLKSFFQEFEHRIGHIEERLTSLHPSLQQEQMLRNIHSPSQEDLNGQQESKFDASKEWQTLARISSGQCATEVVPEHRILVCGRPCSDKKSARNEE